MVQGEEAALWSKEHSDLGRKKNSFAVQQVSVLPIQIMQQQIHWEEGSFNVNVVCKKLPLFKFGICLYCGPVKLDVLL